MRMESHSLWHWVPALNDDASFTWLMIQNVFWVGKNLFATGLAILPECLPCGEMEESIDHAFFH